MRDLFFGYYPPTKDEYETLWREGLIVLDTNVLLDLYRLPKEAREEFLGVLDALKKRLWLPYQVALEFQSRRLTVIAAERKATESALGTTSDLVAQVKERVNSLQIEKHSLGLDPKPLLDDLESANSKVVDAIKAVHDSQLDIAATDPIRERVDRIITKNIGPAPTDQADLDRLIEGGEDRYCSKVPPGYSDALKDKNPNEAEFVHNGLVYQRKFGDLILWRQLLTHAKSKSLKNVLFITSDKKEDWWWREQGKTIGPHPELISEIRRLAGVELFWMYSSVQFLEHASKHTKTKVSDKSVADLQGLLSGSILRSYLKDSPEDADPQISQFTNYEDTENAVRAWIEGNYGKVIPTNSFPDFISIGQEGGHGFEVKHIQDFKRWSFPPGVTSSMLRGQLEMLKGQLHRFTLVGIISERDYFDILDRGAVEGLHHRLVRLLKKHPITSVVVGMVTPDGRFQPLAHAG